MRSRICCFNLIPYCKPIKHFSNASCIKRVAHQKSLAVRDMFRVFYLDLSPFSCSLYVIDRLMATLGAHSSLAL
jgi:hypothetical protein